MNYYYSEPIMDFLHRSSESILGFLADRDSFTFTDRQKNAWKKQIRILQQELLTLNEGTVVFEYTIPRIGKRIDNVIIYKNLVFLLEFKVDEKQYTDSACQQIIDYALNLKNFHEESQHICLVPILVATEAPNRSTETEYLKDGILNVIYCNSTNICSAIKTVLEEKGHDENINASQWLDSAYRPTPTIIEAAQKLYRDHGVSAITRNDAGSQNLSLTNAAISRIIEISKSQKQKSICFITGVPGAGKTLAGLNIANSRHDFQQDEHAVFLSGNGPLVDVLQEALIRDELSREQNSKSEISQKVKAFIQLLHHFRDSAFNDNSPIREKVVIFDEAQRAWNQPALAAFLKRKKDISNFGQSEPEFLIEVMDRHADWAVIICLVGGGQEINQGESGLAEWFYAVRKSFPHWNVYLSNQITDKEYIYENTFDKMFEGIRYDFVPELHLGVSLRSFRSENVASFVKALLDGNFQNAKDIYQTFRNEYPLFLTRNLEQAKEWIRNQAKGSERYGMAAHSKAQRLKPHGIWVGENIQAPNWFLNPKEDVRSSYALESTATELVFQGLELDWVLVAWDANMRVENGVWSYYQFRGNRWERKTKNSNLIKNAYRVLLTRARQGMALYVPEGNDKDKTRKPEWYDGIYQVLEFVLS